MTDSLTVFGTDYTGVTGIKAHNTSDSSLLAYIRPEGNLAITQNTASGSSLDVSQYATATVAVPSQESTFVVTVSYNDQTEMWEPDCTWAQVSAAATAGKAIVVNASDIANASADGDYVDAEGGYDPMLSYCVRQLIEEDGTYSQKEIWYEFASTGLVQAGEYTYIEALFESPSVTYTPTTSQQTDTITPGEGYNGIEQVSVTVNAVPAAVVDESGVNHEYTTISGEEVQDTRVD